MGERYIIDTSAVIKYLNNSLQQPAINFLDVVLDDEANLSFVTKIELLCWNPVATEDLLVVQEFTGKANIYFVNNSLIDIAIKIRQATKIKLPDALIAATAIHYNFTLVADNDRDFDKVISLGIGLKYINPVRLQQ
jgi:predicted nucleic acid-binding protein